MSGSWMQLTDNHTSTRLRVDPSLLRPQSSPTPMLLLKHSQIKGCNTAEYTPYTAYAQA
ncbi:uncharacterized protein SETTUDRAFT_163221 [Exserohilum turcica Et28A]|uniref:Uncharacterized protein n=1 Tax=Exserohilum turcicum (strain 28A) TaxID=671987 RepID=R0IRA7_EXST2|nr:uncharacterized protein SETTUDRAFT_163221 [Exserohilum turcica Et28A]EOA87201.1 hypothetical protein SETTUDRAFT_163221 [Exserohilum turcica Et28A]